MQPDKLPRNCQACSDAGAASSSRYSRTLWNTQESSIRSESELRMPKKHCLLTYVKVRLISTVFSCVPVSLENCRDAETNTGITLAEKFPVESDYRAAPCISALICHTISSCAGQINSPERTLFLIVSAICSNNLEESNNRRGTHSVVSGNRLQAT